MEVMKGGKRYSGILLEEVIYCHLSVAREDERFVLPFICRLIKQNYWKKIILFLISIP